MLKLQEVQKQDNIQSKKRNIKIKSDHSCSTIIEQLIFFCINDSFNVYSVFVLLKNDGSSFVFNTDTQDKATAPHRPCSLYIVLINGLADQHKNPYKPSIYLFETLPVMLT